MKASTLIVVISGCDSGLGFATAARLAREGLVVVAGLYSSLESKPAETLRDLQALTVPLDVTDDSSVNGLKTFVQELLQKNPDYTSTLIVVISGCDSGLGFATAARLAREGLVVVAGLYSSLESKPAETLRDLQALTVPLDVTDDSSVNGLKTFVQELLQKNPDYKLHAIVNNAGVMTVGEFEWLTDAMVQRQIDVNLIGPMKLTKVFLPEMRNSATKVSSCDQRPRIINVISHCALQPLPNFAAYSATKSALQAWSDALKIELEPRGIEVVKFIPGSFVTSSNIMSHQTDQGAEMWDNFSNEQREYFGTYFRSMQNYFGQIPKAAQHDSVQDVGLMNSMVEAIIAKRPKSLYKNEPWRYSFYFSLFKLPLWDWMRSFLVKQFISLPSNNKNN